jgi:hypothetical protein
MLDRDFAEYAIKETRNALNCRQGLSPEIQKVLGDIMWDLADSPTKYPERMVSLDRQAGRLWLYKHHDPPIEITLEVDQERKVLYVYHVVVPALPLRRTVFISYCHKDQQWVIMLKTFLTVLERSGVITFWDDSQIRAGERWEESIERALDSARAAVLLVSQDFLVSEFITKCELPRLLSAAERSGKKIFWIPVSPSTVFQTHKEITAFQSPLPDPHISLSERTDVERQKILVQLSDAVNKALS